MAESPTKKTKTEHQPATITATSIWDGLRVQTEGREQSLVGALDADGDLGWLEDEREEVGRKKRDERHTSREGPLPHSLSAHCTFYQFQNSISVKTL